MEEGAERLEDAAWSAIVPEIHVASREPLALITSELSATPGLMSYHTILNMPCLWTCLWAHYNNVFTKVPAVFSWT